MDSLSGLNRTALVTGATSGVGEEAAAQLAAAGFDTVTVTGRTQAKAEAAAKTLSERTGREVFAGLALDLNDRASVDAAIAELAKRNAKIDVLLLNAGLVAGKELTRTNDGVEVTFAASLVGHHRFAMGLLRQGALAPGARIVIAGSEAARGDVMTMTRTDIRTFADTHCNGDLIHAADTLMRQATPVKYKPGNAYADTKAFVALWAAALARRLPEQSTVNAVSPGATPDTQGVRNAPFFMRKIMLPLMKRAPKRLGLAGTLPQAADRYLKALTFSHDLTGQFFASEPRRMTGPMGPVEQPVFNDAELQEAIWTATAHAAGVDFPITPQ